MPQVGLEPTTDIRATDDRSLRLQLVAGHYANDGLQVPPPRETGWTIVSRFMNNAARGARAHRVDEFSTFKLFLSALLQLGTIGHERGA